VNEYRFKVSTGHGFRWITVTGWTALGAEDAAHANLRGDEALVEMTKVYPGMERYASVGLPRSDDTHLETEKEV
jgi:hypothetical protein